VACCHVVLVLSAIRIVARFHSRARAVVIATSREPGCGKARQELGLMGLKTARWRKEGRRCDSGERRADRCRSTRDTLGARRSSIKRAAIRDKSSRRCQRRADRAAVPAVDVPPLYDRRVFELAESGSWRRARLRTSESRRQSPESVATSRWLGTDGRSQPLIVISPPSLKTSAALRFLSRASLRSK
jgi:hypothetical protein